MEINGTGEAPVVAQAGATGSAPAPGVSAEEYERRIADLEAKHKANISALTSAEQKAKQREIDSMRDAYEARMASIQAQMNEIGKRAIGDDYAEVQQRYMQVDPLLPMRVQAGTILLEGKKMGLTYEEIEQLAEDRTLTEQSWKAAARELITMRKLAELEAKAREEREEHMKLIKSLVSEKESAATQAKEEVRKARQELGADLIPSGGPDAPSSSLELRREWEQRFAKLVKSHDMASLSKAKQEYRDRGFDPDKEQWTKPF